MNNFQQITRSPEALGAFLRALPVVEGPWDKEFLGTTTSSLSLVSSVVYVSSMARTVP